MVTSQATLQHLPDSDQEGKAVSDLLGVWRSKGGAASEGEVVHAEGRDGWRAGQRRSTDSAQNRSTAQRQRHVCLAGQLAQETTACASPSKIPPNTTRGARRRVRRVYGATTPGSRSMKMVREQSGWSQKKRRTWSWSHTATSSQGRSAT
jgi:hypothetical protein